MALTGIHIACCPIYNLNNASLIGMPDWSQTGASASGITTSTVPTGVARVFYIRATDAVYVAVGANPDPTQASGTGDSARIPVDAGTVQTIVCAAGQRLAWVLA